MLWLKEKREVEIVLGLRTTFTRRLLKSFITCHLINVHLKHCYLINVHLKNCYLFVTTAGIVCMVDVNGKRQTAKKLLPPSAVCRLYTYVNVLALLVNERTFVIFVLEVLTVWSYIRIKSELIFAVCCFRKHYA